MVNRYLHGGADREEKEFVEKFYNHFDQQPDVLNQFTELERQQLEDDIHKKLLARISPSEPELKISIWRTTWFRMASAACLVLAAGFYISKLPVFNTGSEQATLEVLDVAPGQNKAILTLSNGESIALDASLKGTVALEGQMRITGSGNGELIYNPQGNEPAAASGTNSVRTPAGGQYRLVLPDGSKVWLNAASSVNYPAVFTGSVRKVSITGECYFEIAKDTKRPFVVESANKQQITVLGTHFNVSAYVNDGQIRTTLLEGSVNVGQLAKTNGEALKVLKLSVGEQATMNMDGQLSKKEVDVNQAIAWKDGLFHFQNADVPSVLRQIERWYNVKVVYDATEHSEMFSGKIHRDANLSQMLEILRFSGLNFKLQPSEDKALNGELVLASAHN